jgi:hypothetical protein
VIAVGAFHDQHAQFHPDGLLARYLYGINQTLSHDDAGNLVMIQDEIAEHHFESKSLSVTRSQAYFPTAGRSRALSPAGCDAR